MHGFHEFTESDRKIDSEIRRYIARNPHATALPPYLDSLAAKVDRKLSTPDISKLDLSSIYQLERDIEHLFLGKSERHQIRQKLADYIDSGLQSVSNSLPHLHELPERLRRARRTGAIGMTPDGFHITAWDEKVNCTRLCPDESREECQRLVKRYRPEIMRFLKNNPSCELHFVVLTTPNVPIGELGREKRDQYRKLSNLTRRTWGKKNIKGVFAIQEDPLSKNGDWNPHINAIVITSPRFSYKELRREWGSNLYARWINGTAEDIAKAFLEAVKYAAKHIGSKLSDTGPAKGAPGITDWPFHAFAEWYEAGRNFRRSRSYGCLNGFDRSKGEGITLDLVEWLGVVRHDGTAYQVHFKHSVPNRVDLIQANKSADGSLSRPLSGFHKSRDSGHFHSINT